MPGDVLIPRLLPFPPGITSNLPRCPSSSGVLDFSSCDSIKKRGREVFMCTPFLHPSSLSVFNLFFFYFPFLLRWFLAFTYPPPPFLWWHSQAGSSLHLAFFPISFFLSLLLLNPFSSQSYKHWMLNVCRTEKVRFWSANQPAWRRHSLALKTPEVHLRYANSSSPSLTAVMVQLHTNQLSH